jgi:hypothetical protein
MFLHAGMLRMCHAVVTEAHLTWTRNKKLIKKKDRITEMRDIVQNNLLKEKNGWSIIKACGMTTKKINIYTHTE